MNVGTGAGATTVNIGTNGSGSVVTIGNTTGATGIAENVGTGNFVLSGAAGSNITLGTGITTGAISIGAPLTTGTITIGGTAETGTITLGSSTAANTVNVGTGTGNTTVNIGTGAGNNPVTIGSASGTSSTTIHFGGSAGSPLSNYITTSTFTPVLSFGGGTTGITYTTQSGVYMRIGNMITFTINIVLSSKGSSTGTAAIGGLPVATNTSTVFGLQAANLAIGGISAVASASGSTTSINIVQINNNAAVTTLSNTAFANTTSLTISGSYCI